MKNFYLYLLLICSLLFSCHVFGQATLSDSVNKLQTTVGSINDTLSSIRDSVKGIRSDIRKLRDNMPAAPQLTIDSGAVTYAELHPDSLYKHSFYNRNNWGTAYAVSEWVRYIVCIFLLLLVWYFGYMKFRYSSICRDICFDASGKPKPYDQCPYSYARVQLFWWTMIIFTCYIYFFAVTGVLVPIDTTIGVLLGFSVVTYAGGKVIDNRQIMTNPANARTQDTDNGSKGLFTDIMSDDMGISIHRFQTVVFNVLFGLGFLFYFANALIGHIYPFPEFSAWQYGLLGISSITYLGMKSTENNPAVKPVPTSATNTSTTTTITTNTGNTNTINTTQS